MQKSLFVVLSSERILW